MLHTRKLTQEENQLAENFVKGLMFKPVQWSVKPILGSYIWVQIWITSDYYVLGQSSLMEGYFYGFNLKNKEETIDIKIGSEYSLKQFFLNSKKILNNLETIKNLI